MIITADPHRLQPASHPSGESRCQKRSWLEIWREARPFVQYQSHTLLVNHHCPLALPAKEMLLQGSRVPQKSEGKLFLALSEAEELAEIDIKQRVYTVKAYWWVKHVQRSTCCTQQGWNLLSPPALLPAREQLDSPVTNLFTAWEWTNGRLALCPVQINTRNGSLSNSWKFHLPQIWMKITLSAQYWQAKWGLTSIYMEERLLFILPSNSTNAPGEDQGAGTGKHPLHSAG